MDTQGHNYRLQRQNWTAWDLVLVFLMWVVMMVAMMVPAASPVILLFAEINRRRNEQQDTFVATGQNRCRLSSFRYLTSTFPSVAGRRAWRYVSSRGHARIPD